MTEYRWTMRMIDRREGMSVVAAAAYRAGARLRDEETGRVHDFTWKRGIVYTEVLLPPHAPLCYLDRQNLWNAVQDADGYVNACLAREVEIAIPASLEPHIQIEMVRRYVQDTFVSAGMCADMTIHQRKGKAHAHILLTTRPLRPGGVWDQKSRSAFRLDAGGERIAVLNPDTGMQRTGRRQQKIWERDIVPTSPFSTTAQPRLWRSRWIDFCDRCLAGDGNL